MCTQALLPCGFLRHQSVQIMWWQHRLPCSALSRVLSTRALLSQVGRRHADARLLPPADPSLFLGLLESFLPTPSGTLPPCFVIWFLHVAWSDLNLSRSQGGPVLLVAMVVFWGVSECCCFSLVLGIVSGPG